MTTPLKEMCELQESNHGKPHKEITPTKNKQDEQSVQSLLAVFTSELMADHFNLDDLRDGDIGSLINSLHGSCDAFR